MGFLDHLEELRTRLIRSCVAIAAGMAAAWFFVDRIGEFLLQPTLRVLPPGQPLVYIRPGEGFSFDLDIALIGGCVLASPFVMYQLWRFIAPALYAEEKRFAVPFVLLTTMGTLGGALFNHYMLFPATMAFFRAFDSPLMRFMPGVEMTFQLYIRMLVGMVVAFQIPTLVFSLTRMRLVNARFLWRHLRYAILLTFIVAAFLTPSPDPWNQAVFAAPMIGLYVLSIGIAWMAAPKGEAAPRSAGPRAIGWMLAVAVFETRRAVRNAQRQWRWAA